MFAVAEIGPLLRGNFKLGFFPTVIAGGGAFDGAVGDFVGREGTAGGQREGGFEQDVGFVPVDVVVDVDLVEPRGRLMVCTNLEFCQLRVTRTVGEGPFAPRSSTVSALFSRDGDRSSVPGSMFHAS